MKLTIVWRNILIRQIENFTLKTQSLIDKEDVNKWITSMYVCMNYIYVWITYM